MSERKRKRRESEREKRREREGVWGIPVTNMFGTELGESGSNTRKITTTIKPSFGLDSPFLS